MLDLVYLIATIALFAIVGLVAKGVEKTGPAPRGPAPRESVPRDPLRRGDRG